MRRALFISLALHLAVLVSLGPLLSGADSAQGHAVGLRVALRKATFPQINTAVIIGKGPVDNKMVRADRQSAALPGRLPKSSDSYRFLPSTVAITAFDKKEDQGAQDNVTTSAASGEGEREYRLNVARLARQFRSYPAVAKTQAQEGTVWVAISMSLAADRPKISLQRSSGHDVLDFQAVDMIGQAVKIAAIPTVLQGREFRIVVPVEYRLAE